MATRISSFAIFMLTVSILVLGISGQLPNCGGNVFGILTSCRSFVEKDGPVNPPLASLTACCAALKGANISCYCKFVTPDIENRISMEKALYIANTCQLTDVPKDKCGSYIVPHPPQFKA
ncbi:unnamed protein product [Lathyrus oleraceus]